MNIQTISEKFQLNTDEQKILIYMNQTVTKLKTSIFVNWLKELLLLLVLSLRPVKR